MYVWEVDRFHTWKWLAIIRRSVTRGYVRQLKLCFLTETLFMLLVVTVTVFKWDADKSLEKSVSAEYSHSPDTVCSCVTHSGYWEWGLLLIRISWRLPNYGLMSLSVAFCRRDCMCMQVCMCMQLSWTKVSSYCIILNLFLLVGLKQFLLTVLWVMSQL